MPSGFGDLTDHAHHLVATGDLAGAQRLLSDALTDADPRPTKASAELAELASLQARVLVGLGDPQAARGWAAYAYAASNHLHGRSDERTVTAAATLAAVLHRVGSWSRAARIYQEVIIELTALDGPEALRVLAAHADLATLEYARGQCRVARDRLADAWELHREVYGDGHPSGIKMLARLGAMQRDCGLFASAQESLALAEELCRQHLAEEDPLAGQVAALGRAAADPEHRCGGRAADGREAPIVPAARTPPPGEGPLPEDRLLPDDGLLPHHGSLPDDELLPDDAPLDEAGPQHPSQPGYKPADLYRPPEPARPVAEEHPTAGYSPPPTVPTPRLPVDGAAVHRPPEPFTPDSPISGGEHDPWQPESSTEHWGAAVPPAVLPLTRLEEADGVRRVEPHELPDAPPDQPSRLLPVPVPRATRPPRHRLPLVVGGVVVLLGTAAVIAGVSRFDGSTPPPAADPVTGAPTTPGNTPGTPPGELTLTDNRDNVALSWTYPEGGEGPVVVSGGQPGESQAVFANLPAGSTEFVVHGLNGGVDYCFAVAVVWSTETIARSGDVCTERG